METIMGDMNKIVTEHVRVSDLPAHLCGGLPEGTLVKGTVEAEPMAETAKPRRSLVSLMGTAPKRHNSIEEIVKEISDLRDEWDHR
jgi:hypothetical protein